MEGPEARVLLLSDLHWDNKFCDRAALKRDLDEAKRTGTPVMLIGDTFCAMQGKWDKRKDDRQLRPEHRGGNYLDRLVDTAVEWFSPYAEVLAFVSYGNHETSIIQHHDTDLLQRFDAGLKQANGYQGQVFSYAGFAKLRLSQRGGKYLAKSLAWHHGYGGGGPVSRGLMDNARQSRRAYADVYVSGHIHYRNQDENNIASLDLSSNTITLREQIFVRTGTYKRDDGARAQDMGGWSQEKHGGGERPIGGWWLELKTVRNCTGGGDSTGLRARAVATWS